MAIDIADAYKLFEFTYCAYKTLLECYRNEASLTNALAVEQELQKLKHARHSVTIDISKKYDNLLKNAVAV